MTDSPASPERTLLAGGVFVTMDGEARVLEGDLLIEDGRIAAVGAVDRTQGAGARRVDLDGDLVLPGLVQGHVHLGQTLFRGLGEERRLLRWLSERIWPLEAAHDDDSAQASSLLGAAECLLSGTTTIQEIGIGPGYSGLLAGLRESGLRAFAGPCLMDDRDSLPAGLASTTEEALRTAVEAGDAMEATQDASDRLSFCLNPRFLLSCSEDLWKGVSRLAGERGWPIHTHALEQAEEGEQVRARFGGDEIEVFDRLGVLDHDLRIAHGVQLTGRHLERIGRRRFSVCHCPGSNLKLSSGIADLVAIRAAGHPVSVGADGAPCNNDLDLFEELRLAALLQKLHHGPEAFSGLDALRLATSEGARALGLDEEIGSIEVGKRADLVVLTSERPELWPLPTPSRLRDQSEPHADLHDTIVFQGSRAAVRHVFIEGEPLVMDGTLTRLDLPRILQRAQAQIGLVLQRARLPGVGP